jgi:DNA polymerase-3 subunit chi
MSETAEKVAEFIEVHSPDERLPTVCERTLLHYERGERVAIWCPHPEEAAELDGLLWTFRQNAFIPHVRLEQADERPIEPVVVFSDEPGALSADVLIACAGEEEMPGWFERFTHVYDLAEVHHEGCRQAGRSRYSACKDAGYRMRFVKS